MATFTLFSDVRFPPEIKDIIWIHAIANIPSRVIELHSGNEDTIATLSGDIEVVTYGYVANTPVPVVLHVCSRSRELAMKRWTLTFASKYKVDFRGDGITTEREFERIPRTWFDFEGDTILFLEDTTDLAMNVTLREFKRDIELDTRKRLKTVAFNLTGVVEGGFLPLADDSDDDGDNGEQVARGLHGVFPGTRRFLVIPGGEYWLNYDLKKGLVCDDTVVVQSWDEDILNDLKIAFSREVEDGEVKLEVVGMCY